MYVNIKCEVFPGMFESEYAVNIIDADGQQVWTGYVTKSLVSGLRTTLEGKQVGLVKAYLVEFFEITGMGFIELVAENLSANRFYLSMSMWEPINGQVQS